MVAVGVNGTGAGAVEEVVNRAAYFFKQIMFQNDLDEQRVTVRGDDAGILGADVDITVG